MKKFVFSLEKVLDYKGHIQKLEQDELGKRLMECERLNHSLASLMQEYERRKLEYIARCSQGTKVWELMNLSAYMQELQNRIEEMRKKIEQAQLRVQQQREKLVAVTKEKTSIEKLREKYWDSYTESERKEAEKEINEFVTRSASV